ncbi:MAG TPA: protein YgfX [Gammaproteobacteria bacterium]|nr:protein YgfX [Gammaproteobacteria bacterium]
MSSTRYAAPLNLELRPSRRMAVGLMLVHCVALAALCLPMLVPVALRFLLAAVILWHLIRVLSRHAWLTDSNAVVRLIWGEDGLWTLVNRDGSARTATLLGDSYVSLPLIVLRLSCLDGGTRAVALVGDMVDGDSLRRLRVRLRLEGTGDDEE